MEKTPFASMLTELTRLARNGDHQARNRLLQLLQPHVEHWVAALCAESLRDDVVQCVLIQVMLSLHQLERPAAVVGWVRQIAVHEAYRARRRQGRHAQLPEHYDAADGRHPPWRRLQQAEQGLLLRQAIAALPEPYRRTMYDFYLNEMTVQEISRRHGCPVGTVKRRLHTGRRKLRERLEPRLAV